jgi:hypothetical protein
MITSTWRWLLCLSVCVVCIFFQGHERGATTNSWSFEHRCTRLHHSMFKDEPGTSTHSQKTVGASIRDTSTSFNTTTHDFVSKHFLHFWLHKALVWRVTRFVYASKQVLKVHGSLLSPVLTYENFVLQVVTSICHNPMPNCILSISFTLLQNFRLGSILLLQTNYMRRQCTLRFSINFVNNGRTDNRAKPSLFKSYHLLSFLSHNTLTQYLARWPPNQDPRKRICWIFITGTCYLNKPSFAPLSFVIS